jgi:hypothetical protein
VPNNVLQWCEFEIKGSNGNLNSWHLATREAKHYRSRCGRLFTSLPSIVSNSAPNNVRGVCRRCELISRKDAAIARALRR